MNYYYHFDTSHVILVECVYIFISKSLSSDICYQKIINSHHAKTEWINVETFDTRITIIKFIFSDRKEIVKKSRYFFLISHRLQTYMQN